MNVAGNRYTEWKFLGLGGTAAVYSVLDSELDERVAIKVLDPKLLEANPSLRVMLRQEVLSSRHLRHTYIVAVHDFYDGPVPPFPTEATKPKTLDDVQVDPSSRGFGAVMDIIPGVVELKDWMEDNANALFNTSKARLSVLIKIFEALEIAHARVVHRDLKPQNIMLVKGDIDQPVIMDFGLAMTGEDNGPAGLTIKYASPEQFRHWASGGAASGIRIDKRSDLFTMGVIAFELFTNQIPRQAMKFRADRRTGDIRPVFDAVKASSYNAAVPASLDGVIDSLLADDPDMRPQSASEVLEVLREVQLIDEVATEAGTAAAPRVTVPGGKFILGSSPSESSNPTEKPQRRVVIEAFDVDVTPVTNAAYREFLTSTGWEVPPFMDDPVLGAADHPVVGVTWEDANRYAEWVGGRLPTEAQWEYAAKGGEKRAYPWGAEPWDANRANIDRASSGTTPVGRFPRGNSPFDLADMTGNVWEWCQDAWSEGYYRSLSNGVEDPVCETGDGPDRSVRGGAYNTPALMGRCSARFHFEPGVRNPSVGFRVVYDAAGDSAGGHE
ncbi:MAG: bifunctional serine/threonine-protein kinase/formylglycine-generating enzyme family protein [Gammaproteobacteria bacterium]